MPKPKPRAKPHDHTMDGKPLTLTVRSACRVSGLGPRMLYRLMAEGKVESTRVGRRRLIIFKSLEALVAPQS